MLETERLIIRKFTYDDLPKLIELRSDDEVIKYLGGRRLQNAEAIAKRLRFYLDCYEKFGYGMCAMIWKETNEMIARRIEEFGGRAMPLNFRTTNVLTGRRLSV